MGVKSKDVLTPANAVTVAGLILTIVGVISLNTVVGFILAVVGRLLDIFDGIVARRTRTSTFGAILDPTADKLAGLSILIATYVYHLAPQAFILFVFWQHLAVSIFSLLISLHHKQPQVSKTTKHNMFIHMSALFVWSWSHLVTGFWSKFLQFFGWFFIIAGLYYGIVTTIYYTRQYWHTRS